MQITGRFRDIEKKNIWSLRAPRNRKEENLVPSQRVNLAPKAFFSKPPKRGLVFFNCVSPRFKVPPRSMY